MTYEPTPLPPMLPAETMTPMMEQFWSIKQAHADYLLFYRMGDFYELFFEDAVAAAAALDIALTKRGKHQGHDIPMCGVPAHAAEMYLERLIRKGYRVAICEQTEDPALAKKRGSKAVVARAVTRLVTPGTLTEEQLLEPRAASYLASIARHGNRLAIAWADLSQGAFHTAETVAETAASLIARLDPREVLIAEPLLTDDVLAPVLKDLGRRVVTVGQQAFEPKAAERHLKALYQVETLEGFGSFSTAEVSAAGAIAHYVLLTQKAARPSFRPLAREDDGGTLQIDAATRRNLELVQSLSGEAGSSLLQSVDQTLTAGGSRLLSERLQAPLTDPHAIAKRLDAVDYFVNNESLRLAIRGRLKAAPDVLRALTRLAMGRGGPRDLASVAAGLSTAAAIERITAQHAAATLLPADLHDAVCALPAPASVLDRLKDTVQRSLGPDLPLSSRDGGFIAPGIDADLDTARGLRDDSRRVIAALEARLKEETGIGSLKIRHNNQLGYYVEVSQVHGEKLRAGPQAAGFIHRQSMAGAMRFTTAELSALAAKIVEAAGTVLDRELAIFESLSNAVVAQANAISTVSHGLATLDVSAALAQLATERRFIRPRIDESLAFDIVRGRHPVVEQALQQQKSSGFVPNDCKLATADGARLWLLTGPNMAGKSTFLRQNALIAILAQMGSFVPAESAHIGVVDRLFSRVGAGDDLARGRSTFMVEMIETAAILNRATDRSLVILDEIGRGTATYDGLSIAWATVEQLAKVNRARTLFATHFHELTALAKSLPQIQPMTMSVREWKGGIVFLHSLKPGGADRSYGLAVAKLAGLPTTVIARAQEILKALEERARSRKPIAPMSELPLFAFVSQEDEPSEPALPSSVETFLATIEPDTLTAKEALDLLYKLKTLLRAPSQNP